MSKDNFENIIKNKLSNLEIEPSKDLWLNIESNLNKSTRNRKIGFSILGGLAAAILLAFTFNFLFIPENITNTTSPVYSKIIKEYRQANTYKSKAIIKNDIHDDLLLAKTTKENHQDHQDINRENTHISSEAIILKLDIEAKPSSRIIYNNDRVIMSNNLSTIAKNKRKVQIGLKIASTNTSSSSGNNSLNSIQGFKTSSIEASNLSDKREIPKSELSLNTNINLSFDYPINNRLSITSGLAYLGFSNKKENGIYYGELSDLYKNKAFQDEYNQSEIKKINQHFTYLEIPLQLKYTLIKTRVSLYASAGVGFNFLVKNQSEIIFENGHSSYSKAKNILDNPISSIASLGLSTCIYKSLYINAEAQYRYYYKKISTNESITIEKGMPNLSIGLSIKI